MVKVYQIQSPGFIFMERKLCMMNAQGNRILRLQLQKVELCPAVQAIF
jgi:hypothetical protein